MTAMQKPIITAIMAVLAGAGVRELRQASRLSAHVVALERERTSANQIAERLRAERDSMASGFEAQTEENKSLRLSVAELPKLRGEISRLRADSDELARLKRELNSASQPIDAELAQWKTWVIKLKDRLEQNPKLHIPELGLLSQHDWLKEAAETSNGAQLDTDEEFRGALRGMREVAKNRFGQMVVDALKKYAQANGDQIPHELSELQNYFETPVDPRILERYQLLKSGNLADVPDEEPIVEENAMPVDEQLDSHLTILRNRVEIGGVSYTGEVDNL